MIIIPSKSEKTQSTLIDSLRILAWKQHKSNLKVTGPAAYSAYDEFDAEWRKHEIHLMSLAEVQAYIAELGYEEAELLDNRSRYYELKAQLNRNSAA
ncbi:hypothetical protein [Laspinema olomoucense]|uniref:hypothetical protein n=1 Tax=Laspinema olomoucense TaxID=3231600 RepID=UPI0021BABE89|nr:hypothetical protein [Laspinema sp. D3d]MCT7971164.1 hypothetical protein [Laspinema sp. D3d]